MKIAPKDEDMREITNTGRHQIVDLFLRFSQKCW
jgi:hypothetical protein